MSELLPPIGYQLGIGGIGGVIAGYIVKKISKLVAFLIGIFILALVYLGIKGIISINYEALWKSLEGALSFAGEAASWIASIISVLPFAGSFIVGFAIGFKLG